MIKALEKFISTHHDPTLHEEVEKLFHDYSGLTDNPGKFSRIQERIKAANAAEKAPIQLGKFMAKHGKNIKLGAAGAGLAGLAGLLKGKKDGDNE